MRVLAVSRETCRPLGWGWYRGVRIGTLLLAITLLSCSGITPLAAQLPPVAPSVTKHSVRSDQRALGFLFRESTLQSNALPVLESLPDQSDLQQYQRLVDWVLPGDGHSFRLTGQFRRSLSSVERVAVDVGSGLSPLQAYPESQWIRSPARELIRVAAKVGRLDELALQVRRFTGNDPELSADQVALLTLIEIEKGQVDQVNSRLEDRFGWQRTTEGINRWDRWRDLLVLWSAAENPATSHLITEDLFGVYPELGLYHEDHQIDLVNDYLQLLRGRAQQRSRLDEPAAPEDLLVNQDSAGEGDAADHQDQTAALRNHHYDCFSRTDASTHASARPLTRFHVSRKGAFKVSGHELDYLALTTPIAGDFEVNTHIATGTNQFSELIVHGVGAKAIAGGNAITVGAFAKGAYTIDMVPPLEQVEAVSHARAVMRQGGLTHFFNGRSIFESTDTGTAAPWVAVRSWRRTASGIHRFELAGSPETPEAIDLLDASLSGWASYHNAEINSGLGDWKASVDQDGTVQLVADTLSPLRGSHDEDLIRYVRPLIWDATIRYQFLYQSGHTTVHPVMGRSVLLISHEGVTLHQVTDGRFERSKLRPDNEAQANVDSPSLAKPKLREGWNDAQLRLIGDQLELRINDQPVADIELAAHSSRKFGLFRYRDKTHVSVRNLQLKGDWPRSVPATGQQVLSSKLVTQLDARAADLRAEFSHDFRQGVPPHLFDINGDDLSITRATDGARMTLSEDGGAREIQFCALVEGDFDIEVGYQDLEVSSGPVTWHCGVGLAFHLDNPTRDRCAINRRRDRMQGRHYVGFGQKEVNAGGRTNWVGGENIVDESTSGRLRLVRRGNKVYGLHAIEDSPSFRLVRVTEVPEGRIALHGLRLVADIGKGLQTSVTWTNLQVRAEHIDLLQVKDRQETLAQLNELRKQRPDQSVDLTQQTLEEAGFIPTRSAAASIESDAQGATITVQGDEGANRFSLYKSVTLGADFDVQVDFDVLRLDRGAKDQLAGEVVLQLRLVDPGPFDPERDRLEVYEATMIFRHKWNGTNDLRPRVVGRGRAGRRIYLPVRNVPIKTPDLFRIVQHEKTLYFMYSEHDSDTEVVVATYPLDREVTVSAVNLWSIASGGQCITETCWKKVHIHGTSPQTDLFRLFPIIQGNLRNE